MKLPISSTTIFWILLSLLIAAFALPNLIWYSNEKRFHDLYTRIQLDQHKGEVTQYITDSGFSYLFETTSSLTVITRIGVMNELVLDVDFDDNLRIADKSAFDTGWNFLP